MQVNPNIKKEKWSPAEDERLLILYEDHGGSWAQISRHLEASCPCAAEACQCMLLLILRKRQLTEPNLLLKQRAVGWGMRVCLSCSFMYATPCTSKSHTACQLRHAFAFNEFMLPSVQGETPSGNQSLLAFSSQPQLEHNSNRTVPPKTFPPKIFLPKTFLPKMFPPRTLPLK